MPSTSNTAADRVRISYIEDKDVAEKLSQIAAESRLTLSDLVREATWTYLRKQNAGSAPVSRDPEKPRRKVRRR